MIARVSAITRSSSTTRTLGLLFPLLFSVIRPVQGFHSPALGRGNPAKAARNKFVSIIAEGLACHRAGRFSAHCRSSNKLLDTYSYVSTCKDLCREDENDK